MCNDDHRQLIKKRILLMTIVIITFSCDNSEGIIICFFALYFAGYSVWSCGAYHELGEI